MSTPSETPEPTGDSQSAGAPFLPPAPPAEPVAFDAKAMVESQKRAVQKPVYGAMPKGTPESVAAAKALRAKAVRKRRRKRAFAWLGALVVLGGIGAAGWFGYQAFQADQDQLDADREAAQADGSAGAPGPLTPLGNQQDLIDAVEQVESGGATPSAGGLLDIVDDARAAIEDNSGAPAVDAPPVPTRLTLLDVRPEAVVRLGTTLESLAGYERHVVDGRQLAADSPAEYTRFVALVQSMRQVDPLVITFEVLPKLAPGEIGFAIAHDGDRLIQVIILSADPPIHIDYAP